jgi:hypothetical protein
MIDKLIIQLLSSLKSPVKPSYQSSISSKLFKPKDDRPLPLAFDTLVTVSSSKSLTLDQKKALGLCLKCGENFVSGHKSNCRGIHPMEGEIFFLY